MTEFMNMIGLIFTPVAFALLLLAAGALTAMLFAASARRERVRVRVLSKAEEAALRLNRMMEKGEISAEEYRRLAELLRRG